ncbi:MAG TPA: deoxyribonuclease IV, partial [candidate division Zixibacteria bacterium]|nr:deoxyribonuclease IV [candidate division Zixibacteria bacterium]
GIVPACAHASYLINLASPDRALYAKSVTALVEELRRCDTLELPELVIHPGAHMGKGVEWGVKRVAAAVNRGHDRLPDGRCRVCLETTAGAGTTLGSAFEELAAIVALVEDQRRVSICVDTCHIFAAGYDIGDTKSYRRTIKNLADTLGLRRVAIFHMNDSRADCGERKDRHQHIGRGKIGLEGFRLIMNDRRFANIPKILETPKGPNMAMDVDNIAVLRALIGVKTP